jgi:hypothetical protein
VKSNGHDKTIDKGLIALQQSFEGAKYLNGMGKKCAELMQKGAHREMNIPDAIIMEVYGVITAGENVEIEFKSNTGHGFKAQIESYADLIAFMLGKHPVEEMQPPGEM